MPSPYDIDNARAHASNSIWWLSILEFNFFHISNTNGWNKYRRRNTNIYSSNQSFGFSPCDIRSWFVSIANDAIWIFRFVYDFSSYSLHFKMQFSLYLFTIFCLIITLFTFFPPYSFVFVTTKFFFFKCKMHCSQLCCIFENETHKQWQIDIEMLFIIIFLCLSLSLSLSLSFTLYLSNLSH